MTESVRVHIYGEGHLGDATREVCAMRGIEIVSPDTAEIFWCCIDMGVDENDESDVDGFVAELMDALRPLPASATVVVSTQVPVGTLAQLEALRPEFHFASQPENIRIAHAVADMADQPRIVVGTRHDEDRAILSTLFSNFTRGEILFMSPESAEMVKHALNAFLAMEIVFANEIAALCPKLGADVEDVSAGLRSDPRVGGGPLRPGGPYQGGTLGRDVVVLGKMDPGPLLRAIKKSNDEKLRSA